MKIGNSESPLEPPSLSRRQVLSAVRSLSYGQLIDYCGVALGPNMRRRRSSSDQIKELETSTLDKEALVDAIKIWARGWDESSDDIRVAQKDGWILGPLGLIGTEGGAERRKCSDIVSGLLQLIKAESLPKITADSVCPNAIPLLRIAKELPSKPARTLGYLQVCLTAPDARIANSINRNLFSDPTRSKEHLSSCDLDLPWLVTPWGLVVLPSTTPEERRLQDYIESGDSVFALASIVEHLGGSLLDEETAKHRAPTRLLRVAELVQIHGPAKIADRYLADKDLWELLKSWGLTPPVDLSRMEMLSVLFRQIGLRFVTRPKGLYYLRWQLQIDEKSLQPPDNSLDLLTAFESALGNVFLAYFEILTASELSCEGWRNDEGARALQAAGILSPVFLNGHACQPSPFRTLSFGQKIEAFGYALSLASKNPEMISRLESAGRNLDSVRRLVGSEVRKFVTLRNNLVHPKGKSTASTSSVRRSLLDLLDVLLEGDPLFNTVPPLVRVLEETTDVYGWTRVVLEDELGREFRSSTLRGFHPGDKHSFFFSQTNPVAVDPILVQVD